MFSSIWRLRRRAVGDLKPIKIVGVACHVCDIEVEHFVTIDLAEWKMHRGLFRSSLSREDDFAAMNLCFPCFDKLPADIDEIIVEWIKNLIATPIETSD